MIEFHTKCFECGYDDCSKNIDEWLNSFRKDIAIVGYIHQNTRIYITVQTYTAKSLTQ